jgi:predicted ATP-dependent protease
MKNLVRMDAAAAALTGKRHITSEHVRAAFSKVRFSSEKLKDATGMEFTALEEVVEQVALFYRKDHPGLH